MATQTTPEFRYFIGWVSFSSNGRLRHGGADFRTAAPIRSLKDVKTVQNDLRAHYGDPDLGVVSFCRLAD